ncbi:MAG: Superoxide dismutase [Candidatus Wolfebacteria bacterium GW2011_GWC2_39_22]|uniref:Superoxide dismutase n=1 Tax=Candidatus Wolfebacteria bacterium GW2011_GWC2_39_22 TaxID=1619013 RepID=A0A0G0N9Q4_9BACT|nr:MAG: Superoxide dismutase [Candidatus Wolfebacteria bacterium GW2011_GWC2_39_22]HBI25425.1 superoxide dismutase [Candidatus Wolfebacteria bacterium]
MHTLPQLPYAYNALEPFIDARTLEIHHSKHHQSYVDKLNTALEKYPKLQDKTAEELIAMLDEIPETIRTTVRNNAGGHFSHTLYWNCMSPTAQEDIPEELGKAIVDDFGSIVAFKEQFTVAATNLFGSGWVWLVFDATNKKLTIASTQGHDNPLMTGDTPLMVIDIWEHAYYLHYQNRRAEYIQNWWNVLDWKVVGQNYTEHI